MPLPPPPDGLSIPDDAALRPGPSAWARWRVLVLLVLFAALGWAATTRWGGAPLGLLAAGLAMCCWLALLTAQWICLRRDAPFILEVAEVSREEAERGAIAVGRWQAVPGRLAEFELESEWAPELKPGDRVPVRLQETGYGTLSLVVGQPTMEGLAAAATATGLAITAQFYVVTAFVGFLVAATLALAPTDLLVGTVKEARQEPWVTGLGQEDWEIQVLVDTPLEPLEFVFELSHGEFLELLPEAGRRALATPGLLTGAEREALWAQYLPIGASVLIRWTHLGSVSATFYVGPLP